MATENAFPNYHAFLVRLWRDGEHAPWRASVTHVGTGEAHRFANPHLVWVYIQTQLAATAQDEDAVGAE